MVDALQIERLRRYFCTAAPWLAFRERWSEQDLADMGDAIRMAIEVGEAELLRCWEEWLFGKVQQARSDREFERKQFLDELEREAKELNRRRVD